MYMASDPVVGTFPVWLYATLVSLEFCPILSSGTRATPVYPRPCIETWASVLAVQYRLHAEVAIRGTAISRQELGDLFCCSEIVWLYPFLNAFYITFDMQILVKYLVFLVISIKLTTAVCAFCVRLFDHL